MKRLNLLVGRMMLVPAVFGIAAAVGVGPVVAQGPCPPCEADCNGDYRLDVFDLLCFQNQFAANDPEACDCDTGTGVGVCDVFDFLCFQNLYGRGCDLRPDLTVVEVEHPPCMFAGEFFELGYAISNIGCGPASGRGVRHRAWLSEDCRPGGYLIGDGTDDFEPPLMPQWRRVHRWDNLRVPPLTPFGFYRVVLDFDVDNVIHERNEGNNSGCGPSLRVACGDIDMTRVTVVNGANRRPGELIEVRVDLHNNGGGAWRFPVRVCIGPVCAPDEYVNIGPCGDASAILYVQTPTPGSLTCGAPTFFDVTACALLPEDCNNSNDCETIFRGASVIGDYWDIHITAISGPDPVCSWPQSPPVVRVTIQNRGNMPSLANRYFEVGLCRYSGSNQWRPNCANVVGANTGQPLAPGQSRDILVQVPLFGAICGIDQYWKAGNLADACIAGNYIEQDDVTIHCLPCQ